MTLDEARAAIGRTVVYRYRTLPDKPGQSGVITSVNDQYVFVRYNPLAEHGTATSPEDLEFDA